MEFSCCLVVLFVKRFRLEKSKGQWVFEQISWSDLLAVKYEITYETSNN